jgi:hypothetical protein
MSVAPVKISNMIRFYGEELLVLRAKPCNGQAVPEPLLSNVVSTLLTLMY